MKMHIAPCALAAFLGIGGVANGGELAYALNGVFCMTEQGIIDVYKDTRAGLSIGQSMGIRNTCVHNAKVKFLVSAPVRIGQVGAFGVKFTRYRATLTGIVFDGITIKVDPSVSTYFAVNAESRFQEEMEERPA